MTEELTLSQKLDLLNQKIDEAKENKGRKFRMPLKGKVGKSKLKRGFVTIITLDENKNMGIVKKPIIDGTIKLEDTYHAVDEQDIFIYKGKPAIILQKHRMNPVTLNPVKETYGHKYIIARMKSDVIKANKSKLSGGVIIVVLGVIGAGYWFFTQGGA